VSVVVVLVIGLLAKLSPALGIAVGVPVYLGLMLVFYVVAFGYYYHAWRDIYAEPVVVAGDALVA
jgi:flagellar biosynthesis protein FliR